MMDLFRELLLIVLLLRLSEGNDEWETTPASDRSVHYGEFCLRIADSPRSSSETVLQPSIQPSKSSPQPPKHVTQPPDQPVTEQIPREPMDFREPKSLIDGCRCKEEKDVLTDESVRLRQIKITSPHDSCNSVVLILTLMNDTEVCSPEASTVSLLALYNKLKQSATPLVHKLPDIAPYRDEPDFVPDNPIEHVPFIRHVTKNNQDPSSPTVGLNPDEEIESIHVPVFSMPPTCETCDITTNMRNVDPTAIQSLDVKMAPFYCPLYINITLKDGQVFCLDSGKPEFEATLMTLEMPPSSENHTAPTPKNSTEECLCEGREQKTSQRHLLINTKIWPPSEACSSMEFIETLVNGSEVCVTAANISAYLKQLTSNEPGLELVTVFPGIRHDYDSYEVNRFPHLDLKERNLIMKTDRDRDRVVEASPCLMCDMPEEWNSLDPNDVESVDLKLIEPHCPVLLFVTLKNHDGFCIDSDHSMFLSLLEKLDSPRV